MYAFSDRNNASQARLRGFEEDLKLKGQEFATLLSILYVVSNHARLRQIYSSKHRRCGAGLHLDASTVEHDHRQDHAPELVYCRRHVDLGCYQVHGQLWCRIRAGLTIFLCDSVLTGITHNFVGALLTRFFLGFIEAAFLPGALFLLSKWYTKKEIALRYTILYSVSFTRVSLEMAPAKSHLHSIG